MKKKAQHSYAGITIKRLYSLSGNRCAFPDCEVVFTNNHSNLNLSEICHIHDANPNTNGIDRYDASISDEKLKTYDNLILLCPTHHRLIDCDFEVYTVGALQTMKKNHENKVNLMLSDNTILSKHPSALSNVINHIGNSRFFEADIAEPQNAPDPEDKISYNNIIVFKPIIEEYKIYQGKLNKIYEEIENQGSQKKSFLLENIKTIYLQEKVQYNSFDEIKVNADKIIENIKNKLWEIIESSPNIDKDMPYEAINVALLIVMVDAFMRCNILEEPPKL